MNVLIAGMQRYRRWIDRRDFNVLLASWLLSGLVILAMNFLAWSLLVGCYYGTWIGLARAPESPEGVWLRRNELWASMTLPEQVAFVRGQLNAHEAQT